MEQINFTRNRDEKSVGVLYYRSSHKRCFTEKAVLKNFAIFTGKHPGVRLFKKSQAFKQATLLKRDSKTGVFLWILWIFKNYCFEEHLRTDASDTIMIVCFTFVGKILDHFKLARQKILTLSPMACFSFSTVV